MKIIKGIPAYMPTEAEIQKEIEDRWETVYERKPLFDQKTVGGYLEKTIRTTSINAIIVYCVFLNGKWVKHYEII